MTGVQIPPTKMFQHESNHNSNDKNALGLQSLQKRKRQ